MKADWATERTVEGSAPSKGKALDGSRDRKKEKDRMRAEE